MSKTRTSRSFNEAAFATRAEVARGLAPNAALAWQVRGMRGTVGSDVLRRKALGVVEVALATTDSVAGARRVMERYRLADDVRDAALALLDEVNVGTAAG